MTDDAPRVLTEEGRARIRAAARRGGLCAGCGRTLADDEPVWWVRFALRSAYDRPAYLWAPAGRECAPSALLRATEADEPRRCLGCDRGIYYGPRPRPRGLVCCSRRCRDRAARRRAKEARR